MVGGLKMKNKQTEKHCLLGSAYSGLRNSSSKLEMGRVKHQGLDRYIPGAEIYLRVSLHVPAGKFRDTRGVHRDLACLEWYRI